MRLNQSWKSEVHQIVEARVVHVLSCWCRILLEVRKISRILSAAVNVFTFTKFKSISKHSKVFFTSVFKNSFLMKSLELFLYIKPIFLIRERQFAFVYNDVFLRYQVQVFSSPLANLSLCNCKHEIDQNPEWTQPKLFPHLKPWRRRLVWPHLLSHDLHWENKA